MSRAFVPFFEFHSIRFHFSRPMHQPVNLRSTKINYFLRLYLVKCTQNGTCHCVVSFLCTCLCLSVCVRVNKMSNKCSVHTKHEWTEDNSILTIFVCAYNYWVGSDKKNEYEYVFNPNAYECAVRTSHGNGMHGHGWMCIASNIINWWFKIVYGTSRFDKIVFALHILKLVCSYLIKWICEFVCVRQ